VGGGEREQNVKKRGITRGRAEKSIKKAGTYFFQTSRDNQRKASLTKEKGKFARRKLWKEARVKRGWFLMELTFFALSK